jgi:peptidyl-prolyl cis-trans isomerase A (cyclophilin A)
MPDTPVLETYELRGSMRTCASICLLIAAISVAGMSQTTPAAKPAPAKKPSASVAKPAATAGTGSTAIIDTTAGKLTCTLFPDVAPIGVANFIGLAQGTKDWTNPVSHAKKHGVPLYDGTIFHRVIPEFMIQGGDPAGTGSGEVGFEFKNETSPTLKFDRPGRLAYANAGPNTNGSQFFITEVPYPHLNGGYTIFGQCDDATVALVKQIARMGRDSNDRPYRPVKINHITITKGGAAAATKPAAAKPATTTKPAVKKPATPATAPQ